MFYFWEGSLLYQKKQENQESNYYSSFHNQKILV